MDFVTYNVNSITTRLERVRQLLAETNPDVALLQETKVAEFPSLGFADLPYRVLDHSGGRWAGVAMLVRKDHDISDVVTGLAGEPAEDEARWIEATVDGIRVASVYVPNGRQVDSDTYVEKLVFLDAMVVWTRETNGPTVVAGDMNVCPTDADPAKGGVDADSALTLVQFLQSQPKLVPRGLMTILAADADPGASYQSMAQLFTHLASEIDRGRRAQWDTLSMGMTGDLEQAIANGATHIRIGTALFGARTAAAG